MSTATVDYPLGTAYAEYFVRDLIRQVNKPVLTNPNRKKDVTTETPVKIGLTGAIFVDATALNGLTHVTLIAVADQYEDWRNWQDAEFPHFQEQNPRDRSTDFTVYNRQLWTRLVLEYFCYELDPVREGIVLDVMEADRFTDKGESQQIDGYDFVYRRLEP